MANKVVLNPDELKQLLDTLRKRFEKNMTRHSGISWDEVEQRLKHHSEKLWSLHLMENSGGEPDVVGKDMNSGEVLFYDCSAESPKGRRSLCYDEASLESRKEFKPKHSAAGLAAEMGITLLSEEEYSQLQQLGEFDLKTSSWLLTPAEVRKLGGAIFGDRRFNRVFVYHNGAESYYAARGFRGCLKV